MFPVPPALNQWFQTILSPLANQYLFPSIPAGASNPQTQTYGTLGGPYGNLPSTAVQPITGPHLPPGPPRAGATASSVFSPNMTTSPLGLTPTIGSVSTPPPLPVPTYGQPAPGAVRTPLGGTESGGIGTITQPPPIAPAGRESDSAFRAGAVSAAAIQQPTGTNAYGLTAPTMISGNQAITDGYSNSEMAAAGYVQDSNGNWILSGTAAASVAGATAPTGNEYWRTSGSNYGQVGLGGKVHGQSFQSEQAYNSWQHRKKRQSKKEEEKGMTRATLIATPSYGTG